MSATFSENDIHAYVFSWKKVTDNAVSLYNKVATAMPNTTLINCDENRQELGVSRLIQLDDSYYYGGQFGTAIQNCPPGKILCCIVGDVEPTADWATIARNAAAAFNRGDVGIYAPNVDYTWHTQRGANITDTLAEVPNTDCTCWFIHPRLVQKLRAIDYRKMSNLGWGIDHIFMEDARAARLYVARDYSVLVRQPQGTAYDQQLARKQMRLLTSYYERVVKHKKE